jgi:hypothetical protein
MGFSLSDIPVAGDIYDAVRGDPDAIKAAYDQQIKASQASQQQLQKFLMGQKGQTLAYFNPIQHMYQAAYGTEGLRPQGMAPPAASLAQIYGGGAPSVDSSRAAGEMFQRPMGQKGR